MKCPLRRFRSEHFKNLKCSTSHNNVLRMAPRPRRIMCTRTPVLWGPLRPGARGRDHPPSPTPAAWSCSPRAPGATRPATLQCFTSVSSPRAGEEVELVLVEEVEVVEVVVEEEVGEEVVVMEEVVEEVQVQVPRKVDGRSGLMSRNAKGLLRIQDGRLSLLHAVLYFLCFMLFFPFFFQCDIYTALTLLAGCKTNINIVTLTLNICIFMTINNKKDCCWYV